MNIQTQANTDEYEARLILFSAIEPGHKGWGQEIQRLGAIKVLEGLFSGQYDSKSCSALLEKIERTNNEMLTLALDASQSHFIYPGHPQWPKQVDQLSNPPIGLIVKGSISTLAEKSIAIVGTREPTEYGREIASEFAAAFVSHDWHVVSGGALGIDTSAHISALRTSGKTLAVIASGRVRPRCRSARGR